MSFNTHEFAVFFVIVYGLYLALQTNLRRQNAMLLVASYVFYGFWNWKFLSLIFISTVLDYVCSRKIFESADPKRRKFFLVLSLAGNLSMLCFFKYYDFFITNVQTALDGMGVDVRLHVLNVILPVGISFYTFQTMSYTLDVFNKKMPASDHFLDFALYVSYFPQLVAGPIERGTNLYPQVASPRTLVREDVLRGFFLVYWGLFLKMFVADNLAKLVDPVFAAPPPYRGSEVLIATYAFAFQIFGDFAGYSYIAIGLARMMGIRLMDNFKRPYFSTDISEFWRRWHISLSSWFRDYMFSPYYLYIDRSDRFKKLPLRVRHNLIFFVALMVTELLLGFWHGANWNFGLFGLYHGVLIWAYYYTRKFWDRMPRLLRVFLTFHLVCLGWLIFRVQSLAQLGDMIHSLLFHFQFLPNIGLKAKLLDIIFYSWLLVLIQLLSLKADDTMAVTRWPTPVRWFLYTLIFCLTAVWGEFGARQFIYFQF
ncbi:MBOAT family protein [bacterium]|nr:MBOAT family protein [bacterium]